MGAEISTTVVDDSVVVYLTCSIEDKVNRMRKLPILVALDEYWMLLTSLLICVSIIQGPRRHDPSDNGLKQFVRIPYDIDRSRMNEIASAVQFGLHDNVDFIDESYTNTVVFRGFDHDYALPRPEVDDKYAVRLTPEEYAYIASLNVDSRANLFNLWEICYKLLSNADHRIIITPSSCLTIDAFSALRYL